MKNSSGFCDMLKPLKDGHVNPKAKSSLGKKQTFSSEDTSRFFKEFNTGKLEKQLGSVVASALNARVFSEQKEATYLLDIHLTRTTDTCLLPSLRVSPSAV